MPMLGAFCDVDAGTEICCTIDGRRAQGPVCGFRASTEILYSRERQSSRAEPGVADLCPLTESPRGNRSGRHAMPRDRLSLWIPRAAGGPRLLAGCAQEIET